MKRAVLVATLAILMMMAAIGSWTLLAAQSNIVNTTNSDKSSIATSPIYCGERPLNKMWSWISKMWGWRRGVHVELSEEFKDKVTNIVKNDPDVKKLIDDGYNITSIKPVFKVSVDANGNVAVKVTNATVLLQKNRVGCALVQVDLEHGKVVNIVISTKTVIQKQ